MFATIPSNHTDDTLNNLDKWFKKYNSWYTATTIKLNCHIVEYKECMACVKSD